MKAAKLTQYMCAAFGRRAAGPWAMNKLPRVQVWVTGKGLITGDLKHVNGDKDFMIMNYDGQHHGLYIKKAANKQAIQDAVKQRKSGTPWPPKPLELLEIEKPPIPRPPRKPIKVKVEVDGTLIKKNVYKKKNRNSFVLRNYDGKRDLTIMKPANIQRIEEAWRQREQGQTYPQPLLLQPEKPPGTRKAAGRKRKRNEFEEEDEEEEEEELEGEEEKEESV
jgi:hypothetical protein